MADPLEGLLSRIPVKDLKANRPSVTLSYAQSLDGSIASSSSRSLPLSSPESLRMTHNLRAVHEAILVGIGTVLADNPRLTVREVEGEHPQAVLLDTHLRTPQEALILRHPKPPLIATGGNPNQERAAELESAGGRVLLGPTGDDGRVFLPTLLERLWQLGIVSLMVEGGAQVISSFLKNRLVDALVLTIAPSIVGGLHAVGDLGSEPPMPRLSSPQWSEFGPDWVVWGELEW